VFWCAVGRVALGQDVPLVSGNYEIARKFLHGDAHVLVLGDSIHNGMIGLYPKSWKPDKWAGQVVGPNLDVAAAGNTGAYALTFNPTPPFVASNLRYTPAAPPAGLAGFAPGAVQHVTFNAVQAGSGGDLLSNRYYEVNLIPGQEQIYSSGKWADRSDGRINVEVLLYANPQGIESGAQLDVRTNSNTVPDLTIPLNARAAQGGIVKFSGSFPAHAWDPGKGLSATFRLADGTTPQAGSNLPILGVRIHTGESGFELANISQGAQGIDYFTNPAHTTDKNLADYLAGTDSNIAFIWLGQNDPGKYQAAAWKQKMEELISRYKAARPGMEFVLVATYDTGSPTLAGYSAALDEIAQSDPDVLFLNLYRAAGDFSFLNPKYLLDGVHPNPAGFEYIAGKTQELLELADAQVPEPGAVAGGMLAFCLAARRRRR
jgi:lysophospholipase L1-like esterase